MLIIPSIFGPALPSLRSERVVFISAGYRVEKSGADMTVQKIYRMPLCEFKLTLTNTNKLSFAFNSKVLPKIIHEQPYRIYHPDAVTLIPKAGDEPFYLLIHDEGKRLVIFRIEVGGPIKMSSY